ncbi:MULTISPECIES: site-specific integrase [unclassified Polaromonas]|jgi:integrase|uniref:tyrosine-type recombinase/integrase n=1 Tax=unclassified Polaromonas TaxID=2638319 RepID=UPI000BDA35DC|nr:MULTISPECIES: site-specific integrase [unclassified Polaromonas]OYY37987.1 MAG: integrase [Polaromonas sp. 35-63-35]OYZ18428.1 MAG: integrase [Polaromonas sp. 16-63-31]OYZ79533.1 MAG: integrase [Polaromonas sp. 24-63-21]OZA50680.1 MAG: integrase [Polaromonas sp. 17-63-33]OZA89538.1 MAG: integrase [Polaromonas sp. 39-63-25]
MTLYKREKYWWVKFAPIKGELKPFFKSTGTAVKRDAQKYHDKLMAERWEQDKLGVKPHYTWDEAAAKFLEETSHKRTHEWDKSMLRWFQPLLGGKDLIDINRALLDQVRVVRGKGVSTATVNRYMALVRTILRKACNEWEWIDRAPKVGMFRDAEGRIRSLSREEFSRLLAELPPHLADMAQFSVATGLRQANVTRLQWKQISLERRHLWVAGNDHKNGRPHSVPLNEVALDVLQRRQGDHPTHVFTYEGNSIVQVNTKAWRNALLRAGIHDFRWHDLRHTFATWHREAGTPTHELQRLGGWKTQSMVERYAHVAPEGLQAAANRLDTLLSAGAIRAN